jgi:hypothetical protein
MYDMFDQNFPKADSVSRGCGDREPGGVYCECGLSSRGRPLEEFLIDPPLPVPDGLDLVNKPQLWQRTHPTGEAALDAEGDLIYDLLIWVGEEFYAYCSDYIEETRQFGASRRLNPHLDLSLLSRSSRMILAHPRARNTAWQTQRPPEICRKDIPGHATSTSDIDGEGEDTLLMQLMRLAASGSDTESSPADVPHNGPCLFKVWELIPREAAQTVLELDEFETEDVASGPQNAPLCLRAIGSTVYPYRPTGESADGLVPGIFAALPITGFAFIRFDDGSVNDRAKEKVLAGLESHGHLAIPFYETDR